MHKKPQKDAPFTVNKAVTWSKENKALQEHIHADE